MKRIVIPIAFSLLVFVNACTERIDVDLDSGFTRCIIYGEITTDTTQHKVIVTRSGDYFGQMQPEGISGAQVTISDGENEFPLTEDETNPGVYLTGGNVFGVSGRTYTLSVSNVNLLGDGVLKSYQATSELYTVASPDSIDVVYRSEWQGWVVQAWATDPAETKDFYMFHVYVNGVLNSDSLTNIIVTDDQFFNGSQTNGVVIYYLEGEEALVVNDTISAAFCGITEDFYKYIIEVQTSARPSNPLFSSPPANPRTNLNNNAIGYFTAYSKATTSKVIKPLD